MSETACRDGRLGADKVAPWGAPGLRLTPDWFALRTSSRHEKGVEQHFRRRDGESFLPVYPVRRTSGAMA
jgi:hypothetical protein